MNELKVGDRVKIGVIGRSTLHGCSADGQNPLNFAGEVIEEFREYSKVRWDNGHSSTYWNTSLTKIPTRI